MVIYYFLYTLLIFGTLYQLNFDKTEKGKRNFCIFSFVLIAGLLALRHPNMGIDLRYGSEYGYLGMYKTIGESSWEHILKYDFHHYEKGYVVFCKLISYLGINEQVLLISCSVVSIGIIAYCFYKYSDNCFLSFIIYLGLPVFLANYSALRQALAIALTIYSYKFIRDKKVIQFILIVLLACTFHSSAIVFLVAYPLYYLKPMRQLRIISVVILPFVYLLRYPLFGILSKIFKSNAVPDNNSAITLFLVFSAIYIFLILFSSKNDVHEDGLTNLFWLACVCQAFGGVYSTAIRVGYYFMIYLAFSLPKKLLNMKTNLRDYGKTHMIFFVIITFCFGIFGLYSIYETYWSMSYPYYFYWQEYIPVF